MSVCHTSPVSYASVLSWSYTLEKKNDSLTRTPCCTYLRRKRKHWGLDQKSNISNGTASSAGALLMIFFAQLRKAEHIQALGVFTSMGMGPREPLGTGNLGVVETNDWKCFLSEAICNMLLILPHHKINSLSTFVGAIKEMSTIPEKFIYQAFNWKVPKLLYYQDFPHGIRLSKLSQGCNIALFLFLYKMHCAARRP